MTGPVGAQRGQQRAAVGGQRGRRRRQREHSTRLIARESSERGRIGCGDPHAFADRRHRGCCAADLRRERHGRSLGVDQRDRRVERVGDPHAGRAGGDRPRARADRDLVAHLPSGRIQSRDSPDRRQGRPHRAEAVREAAHMAVQLRRAEHVAGARIDPGDGWLTTVGDPHHAVGCDKLGRARSNGNALHDAVARHVDAHDLTVRRHRDPHVPPGRGDADRAVPDRHGLGHHAAAVKAQERSVVGCRGPARAQPGDDPRGCRGQRARGSRPIGHRVQGDECRPARNDRGRAVIGAVAARPHRRRPSGKHGDRGDDGRLPPPIGRRAVRWRRHGFARRRPGIGVKRRVLPKDALLHRAQRRARFETQLVDEAAPHDRVVLQRLGLRARSVQRHHQQLVQPLATRMATGLRVKRRDDLGGVAELQFRFPPRLQRQQARLVECCGVGAQRRPVGQPIQSRAAPERKCLAEARGRCARVTTRARITGGRDERLELITVDLVAIERQPVAHRR